MSQSVQCITLPLDTRELILGAIDSVMCDARVGYKPATPSGLATGWIDFHPFAARQARTLIADAVGVKSLDVPLNTQQVEAVTKILNRSHYASRSPERKKLALAARKALGTVEVQST